MRQIDALSGGSRHLEPSSLERNFSMVLVRTIEALKEDPAQFRNAIYELARVKLQRECLLNNPPMSVLETRRLMLAFETAIEGIESSWSPDSAPKLNSHELVIVGSSNDPLE